MYEHANMIKVWLQDAGKMAFCVLFSSPIRKEEHKHARAAPSPSSLYQPILLNHPASEPCRLRLKQVTHAFGNTQLTYRNPPHIIQHTLGTRHHANPLPCSPHASQQPPIRDPSVRQAKREGRTNNSRGLLTARVTRHSTYARDGKVHACRRPRRTRRRKRSANFVEQRQVLRRTR
jgi:hypothetical protein